MASSLSNVMSGEVVMIAMGTMCAVPKQIFRSVHVDMMAQLNQNISA